MGGLRWFTAAGALFAAAWLWSLARLPERVPMHFGGSGEPDAWGSRTSALWTSALLGLGVAALFAALVWLIGRTRAEHLNVPHPEYWKQPEHLPRLRQLVAEDLWLLGACTLLLAAAVQVLIVRASTMAEPRLDAWAFVAVGLYLVAVLGRVGWMLTRRYAVPDPG